MSWSTASRVKLSLDLRISYSRKSRRKKLAYYEIKTYKVFPCRIHFMDWKSPAEVSGKTFMYAGDQKALLEQRFDRKLSGLLMGGKLD